ncbi:glucose 1-dehydrogenase [Pseudomonas alliivorans]|nr:glucose 1-dehydrogenase [Pseudomonas alliivorans]
MMNYEFEGKAALITGAASGLGYAAAAAFAAEGAMVVLADHDADAAYAAAETLTVQGFNVHGIVCDVTDEQQVKKLIAETIKRFGRLDFAYNNAGIQVPVVETADAEGADFDRLNAVNYRGIWNCMKYELQHMRTQQAGVIVNCSSQTGVVGVPGLGAYTASKHAVIGLTRSAALEYAARGIRVNAICPGACLTAMVQKALQDEPETMNGVIREIPIGRLGKPEEIASAVLWLCSPGAGFMTGQVLVLDGGSTTR